MPILREIPSCRAPIGAAIQSRRTQIRSGRLALSLRTLRQKRGWSQTELATRAGVQQALVSAIEVESANPTIESLDKIASALGVRIEDLFGRGEG
jgi:transcriptional regulator with XRE-family HTH domain